MLVLVVPACGAKIDSLPQQSTSSGGMVVAQPTPSGNAGEPGVEMTTGSVLAAGGTTSINVEPPLLGGAPVIVVTSISTGGARPAVGGSSAGGTTSKSIPMGFGGLPFTGYCAGTIPKVQIQNVDYLPSVGTYTPPARDCCADYGLSLQTGADVGYDLHIDVAISPTGLPSTTRGVCYTNNKECPQVIVSRSTDAAGNEANTEGTLRLDKYPANTTANDFGICVQVNDKSSVLFGTKVFVPSHTDGPYY